MKPAIRTQVDDRQLDFSILTAFDNSAEPDPVRQEFKDEADVNVMLNKFGMNVPMQRQPQFGETDFDLDLHSAYIAVDRVNHAMQALPPELREKYPTAARLLDAMNSGELEADLLDARERAREKEAGPRPKAAATPAPEGSPEPVKEAAEAPVPRPPK